jgi:hypothetical protein
LPARLQCFEGDPGDRYHFFRVLHHSKDMPVIAAAADPLGNAEILLMPGECQWYHRDFAFSGFFPCSSSVASACMTLRPAASATESILDANLQFISYFLDISRCEFYQFEKSLETMLLI